MLKIAKQSLRGLVAWGSRPHSHTKYSGIAVGYTWGMEKFNFAENSNESLCTEIVRRIRSFIEDSKRILVTYIINISLIDKLLEATTSYKEALMQVTAENDEENAQIKSALQDLIDLEIICNQRKTLH